MNKLARKLSPTITGMIRFDHTHVMATFHQYRRDDSAGTREALVNTICTALEIHAQLEEEIFYPALQRVAPGDPVLEKSTPEHNEMKRLIARLRSMSPDDSAYESTLMELMRDVMHHVADEETTLLPLAEQVLANELRPLGMAMTKRRLELAGPRAGEIVGDLARGMPTTSVLVAAGALLAGTYLVTRPAAH